MATVYPRQEFARQEQDVQVFNYPLPEYYYEPSSQPHVSRSADHYSDCVPRSMFINPQHLMVDMPASPQPMGEYFVPEVQHTMPSGSTIRERLSEDYMPSDQRARPSQQRSWSHGQLPKSHSFSGSPVHRGSPPRATFRSSLPSPPASPTRRSSAPKSATGVAAVTSSHASSRHYCNHPSCLDPQTGRPTKSFSRRADLQRHHACTHDSPGLYSCPRPNCIRKGDNGFTRQDHLIEHRRGYHGEQIPKRGSRSSDKKH